MVSFLICWVLVEENGSIQTLVFNRPRAPKKSLLQRREIELELLIVKEELNKHHRLSLNVKKLNIFFQMNWSKIQDSGSTRDARAFVLIKYHWMASMLKIIWI
ncbi:hypothetical protein ACQJBY_053188 [Aegilops geniculata]